MSTDGVKEALVQLEEAVLRREEGIMIKNLEAKYHPGERPPAVWMKVKPDQQNSSLSDSLDLLILGAYWGTKFGKNHVSHFLLGVPERDPETGNIEKCVLFFSVSPLFFSPHSSNSSSVRSGNNSVHLGASKSSSEFSKSYTVTAKCV